MKIMLQDIQKQLPVVWPLHQFIALNPLWDAIDQDLLQLTKTLHKQVGLQATLSLNDYSLFYHRDIISDDILKSSIRSVLSKQYGQETTFQDAQNLLEKTVFTFMVSSDYQKKLHHYEQEFAFSEPNDKLFLMAYQMRSYCYTDTFAWVKSECLRWIAAFFDLGQAIWPMPCQHNVLFEDWRDCLSASSKRWKTFFTTAPQAIDDFINYCVKLLNIPEHKLNTYYTQVAWQLKGWAGYVKWLNTYPDNPWTEKKASLAMLIAMWLAYECFLLKRQEKQLKPFLEKYRQHPDLWGENIVDTLMPGAPYETAHAESYSKKQANLSSEGIDSSISIWLDYLSKQANTIANEKERAQFIASLSVFSLDRFLLRWIWQTAWEKHYQHRLLKKLAYSPTPTSDLNTGKTPQAQWVFCIDTRSERLRYLIEQQCGHQTFGFAGFFGFTFQCQDTKKGKTTTQSPALIQSTHILNYSQEIQSTVQKSASLFNKGIKQAKNHLLAPFALFEVVGCLFLFKLLFKTVCPHLSKRLAQWIRLKQKNPTPVIASPFDSDKHPCPFDLEQAAQAAEQLLRLIGLTKTFSNYIIICGHRASSDNNPYQASLDCGACGGNSGYINAIVACQAFNHPEVRNKLATRGLVIPDTTQFIAACHNTTTDRLFWADDNEANCKINNPGEWETIKTAAQATCELVRAQRLKHLKGDKNTFVRATHWAELVPELGLANNAAMVVGPRWLTQNSSLDGRVFLHSYDPSEDSKGTLLEAILTAPLVVAHWINSQYYFSTTDPQLYGSGNKAIHNVIGKLGIIEGNQGDLQVGLPTQSVFHLSEFVHEPRRLFAIIYAKRDHVNAIINKQPTLKALVEGHWLFLHVIEPGSKIG